MTSLVFHSTLKRKKIKNPTVGSLLRAECSSNIFDQAAKRKEASVLPALLADGFREEDARRASAMTGEKRIPCVLGSKVSMEEWNNYSHSKEMEILYLILKIFS
jgi:hypothetical protein